MYGLVQRLPFTLFPNSMNFYHYGMYITEIVINFRELYKNSGLLFHSRLFQFIFFYIRFTLFSMVFDILDNRDID